MLHIRFDPFILLMRICIALLSVCLFCVPLPLTATAIGHEIRAAEVTGVCLHLCPVPEETEWQILLEWQAHGSETSLPWEGPARFAARFSVGTAEGVTIQSIRPADGVTVTEGEKNAEGEMYILIEGEGPIARSDPVLLMHITISGDPFSKGAPLTIQTEGEYFYCMDGERDIRRYPMEVCSLWEENEEETPEEVETAVETAVEIAAETAAETVTEDQPAPSQEPSWPIYLGCQETEPDENGRYAVRFLFDAKEADLSPFVICMGGGHVTVEVQSLSEKEVSEITAGRGKGDTWVFCTVSGLMGERGYAFFLPSGGETVRVDYRAGGIYVGAAPLRYPRGRSENELYPSRLRRATVSLRLGHAAALTATGCHSLPRRRFATSKRKAWGAAAFPRRKPRSAFAEGRGSAQRSLPRHRRSAEVAGFRQTATFRAISPASAPAERGALAKERCSIRGKPWVFLLCGALFVLFSRHGEKRTSPSRRDLMDAPAIRPTRGEHGR